jgi:hypothetical protein
MKGLELQPKKINLRRKKEKKICQAVPENSLQWNLQRGQLM